MIINLIDAASVIRSKNSSPYELSLDIIFKDLEIYNEVCRKKIIDKKLISKIYNINPRKVINIIEFKAAKAIKITILRSEVSGGIGDTDVYGAQQHAPLLLLKLTI